MLFEVRRIELGCPRVVRRWAGVAGDFVRLEFDATDDGVVERGGCESPRELPLPRLKALLDEADAPALEVEAMLDPIPD